MKKDIYCTPLRLNLRNQRHRKVYEILQNLPEGCSISAYVIQAVLAHDDATADRAEAWTDERPEHAMDWVKAVREIVREELAGAITGDAVECPKEEARGMIPDSEEDFAADGGNEQPGNEFPMDEISEDTLDDLEALLGLAE